MRFERVIVLSVASLGIAALLLPRGRTTHSCFKISLVHDELSSCSITCNSELAQLIQEASLIKWDEAQILHHHRFEAIDRTLNDILKFTENCLGNHTFWGRLYVLGGNFWRTLPIVPKQRREATSFSTIIESEIWNQCHVLCLKKNMHILAHDFSTYARCELNQFTNWILEIGDGKVPTVSFS